jgi:TorA maturation chaperone TorD
MSSHPLTFHPAAWDDGESEEIARAEVYGLLAQLFYAPPDEALYAQLRVAVTEAPARGAFLEAGFSELVAGARRLDRAALRDELAALGLTRVETMAETEDHIAYLCEVLRWLIAGEEAVPLEQQRRFFDAQLRGWVDRLFDALAEHPRADFYRALAVFARDFFAVEGQGFDLLDA